MNPEEYQKVKAVFQSAMEIEPQKRAKFLDNVCANDADLRLEVEKLLNNYESGFMEETAIQNVADLIVDEESLISGEKIGRFEIISRLGKGGMGEVYLAHDKSLNRDVAIKVLLPEFSSDRERVNRFKLEAKAASALNHPNIITIHEVGEDNGKLFIATEHIIGETLRSLIEHKSLTLGSSIKIAEQIASALTSAHKAGIIHRDIKPENIIVREDGFVKVLDFGLAKPTIINAEAETMDLVETKKGMIMGSVGYMSPEQARGKEVDARTDLWSIGVVFYEMLTGKTPFQGDTMTDILANIIHKEPLPISEQLPDNPTELYRIVKKSLRKNADERYQNARDLSLDLKNLRREMELEHELELSVSPERLQAIRSKSNDIQKTVDEDKATKILSNPIITETSVEIARVKSRYRTATLATIGILLIGTLGYFGYGYLKPKRLVETAFQKTTVEKVPINGNVRSLVISPDGKYLVYIMGGGNDRRLILRQVQTGSEKEVFSVKDARVSLESFSSDGEYFYFKNLGQDGSYSLKRLALLGGETDSIPLYSDSSPSFSPDGKKLIFEHEPEEYKVHQIIIADADGKNEKVIFSSTENWVWTPKISPDGSKVLVTYGDVNETERGRKGKLGWIPIDGGEITQIGKSNWNLLDFPIKFEWLKDGSGIVFNSKQTSYEYGQIYLITFPTGELRRINNDANHYLSLSATSDGKTLASIKKSTSSGIWEFEIQTNGFKQVSTSSVQNNGALGIAVSNDKILFVRSNEKGNNDLWQMNFDGTSEKLLVSQKGNIENPIISANINFCYFTTNANSFSDSFPENAIWRMNIDGSNLTKLTSKDGVLRYLQGILPDDKGLIFREWKNAWFDGNYQKLELDSNQTVSILDSTNLDLENLQLSRDGKKALYFSSAKARKKEENRKFTNKLVFFNGSKIGETILTLPDESTSWIYRFAPNGKSIYYTNFVNLSDVWQFDFTTQKSTKVTNFNLDSIYNFTISSDGKKLYLVRGNTTDEVVLIKNVE